MTARGLGVATITATVGSLRAEFVVHVGTVKLVFQIAGAEDSLLVGLTYQLTARLFTSAERSLVSPGSRGSNKP